IRDATVTGVQTCALPISARLLEEYVQDHPSDVAARNQLERMQATDVLILPAKEAALAEVKPSTATEPAISLPLPSNWLPPDVDEIGRASCRDEVWAWWVK